MEDYNLSGWTIVHESAYKGAKGSLSRLVKFGKGRGIDVHKMITKDEFQATPVLIACLGGQLDCVKLLIETGADINDQLQYKSNIQHGLVEVAFIKQDVTILCYLHDVIPNFCSRVVKLMINEENDSEVQSSIAYTLEKLSLADGTPLIKKVFRSIVETLDFGRHFNTFIKSCVNNTVASCSIVLVIIELVKNDDIRKSFCSNGGINLLISAFDREKSSLLKFIEAHSSRSNNIDAHFDDSMNEDERKLPEPSDYLLTASLGKLFAEFMKYDDSIKLFVNENYGEKIINYTKLLFDANELIVMQSIAANSGDSVLFEEYISNYLTCVGYLLVNSVALQNIFLNIKLYEKILTFWYAVEVYCIENFSESLIGSRLFVNSSNLFNSESTLTMKPRFFNILTTKLLKILKSTIIKCLGHVFNNNDHLKQLYIYSMDHQNDEWCKRTNDFINCLIDDLEMTKPFDDDYRSSILTFLTNAADNDPKFQKYLINPKDVGQSRLLFHIKNLLKKNVTKKLREQVIEVIWVFTGSNDYFNTQDIKLNVYKAIGVHRYVDSIIDSDVLTIASLEAIQRLADGPPHRDANNVLVNSSDDVARAHVIPALVRLIKSPNQAIIFGILKSIRKICVSNGYINDSRNQMSLLKLGTLNNLLELYYRKNSTLKMKSQACYSLSSMAMNNSTVFDKIVKIVEEHYDNGIKGLVENMILILNGKSLENLSESKLENIELRINTGMSLCGLCHKNEDFKNYLIEWCGKISFNVFTDLLNELKEVEDELFNGTTTEDNNKIVNEKEVYYKINKGRCLLAFQITFLQNLIEFDEYDDDPRTVSIKILIDTIHFNENTLVRAIAAECMFNLLNTNRSLIEPVISVDTIEIMCKSIDVLRTCDYGDIEIGDYSIVLGFLTNYSPEGRRRIMKVLRKVPTLMTPLSYYNKQLHQDLLEQWTRYQYLMNIAKSKSLYNTHNTHTTTTKEIIKLPPIKTNNVAENLKKYSKLKNLKVYQ